MEFRCLGCKQVFPYEQRAKHKCEYQDVADLERETQEYFVQTKFKLRRGAKIQ